MSDTRSQGEQITYAAAGVDVEAGDKAVELMKADVRRATRPEVLGGLGGEGKSSSDPVPDEANRRLHFYLGKAEGPSHFPTPGYKERWEAEKRALELEDVRLLYVAATRARDHLVIPDFQAKKPGGLLERLDPLLPED